MYIPTLPPNIARPVLSHGDRLHAHNAEPRPCQKRMDSLQRGQKVQIVQKQCRSDFPKVHCFPKLDIFSLSFGQCRKCRKCRFFKNFSAAESIRVN